MQNKNQNLILIENINFQKFIEINEIIIEIMIIVYKIRNKLEDFVNNEESRDQSDVDEFKKIYKNSIEPGIDRNISLETFILRLENFIDRCGDNENQLTKLNKLRIKLITKLNKLKNCFDSIGNQIDTIMNQNYYIKERANFELECCRKENERFDVEKNSQMRIEKEIHTNEKFEHIKGFVSLFLKLLKTKNDFEFISNLYEILYEIEQSNVANSITQVKNDFQMKNNLIIFIVDNKNNIFGFSYKPENTIQKEKLFTFQINPKSLSIQYHAVKTFEKIDRDEPIVNLDDEDILFNIGNGTVIITNNLKNCYNNCNGNIDLDNETRNVNGMLTKENYLIQKIIIIQME